MVPHELFDKSSDFGVKLSKVFEIYSKIGIFSSKRRENRVFSMKKVSKRRDFHVFSTKKKFFLLVKEKKIFFSSSNKKFSCERKNFLS